MVGDGEKGQLKTRGNAGLVEDIRQVALDCLFAKSELLGDIAVTASFDNASDHFELARSEPVCLLLRRSRLLHQVVEGGNEIYDALATDPVIARADGADGGLQMASQRIFQHDAAGANVKCLDDLLRRDGGSQEQDL